jgi:hypothetical protein
MGRQHHCGARRSRQPRRSSGHVAWRIPDGGAFRRDTSVPHHRAHRASGPRSALRAPKRGCCARRRATITACPVGWDRRPTRSQRNIVDRSRTRISAAHAAWWRWSATATPWRRGRRSLAAPHWPPSSCVHTGAVPIGLGDGGRCGGQNSSSSSSMNSVGSKGSSSASSKASSPTLSAS